MKVGGKSYRTIWVNSDDERCIQIIDQRKLPHDFVIEDLRTVDEVATAIADMHVRGAGLIGATAAFGMYLAVLHHEDITASAALLIATRPTAVNLSWAVNRMVMALKAGDDTIAVALKTAKEIADADADACRRIGLEGLSLLEEISRKKKGEVVNVLTHCNAGWLAFVDYGSATAPLYAAHSKGISIHVWVDETRPRNQGARLTAWELLEAGIPHTVISDNTGGHLMQKGMVDLCIVGTDRTTYTGDVANKIGTYLKALAAKDNDIAFYVALPESSIDWDVADGVTDIVIEQRDGKEVTHIEGFSESGMMEVRVTPKGSSAVNYGFDVTPARLITGFITERGVCKSDGLLELYPDRGEGVINFSLDWEKEESAFNAELHSWRQKLYDLGLIGKNAEGIGYGNVSCLTTDGFIITGTQTGGIAVLDSHHYTMVVSTNLSKHWLRCVGGVKASSESLTHAAVYDADSSVTAVIHIHHAGLWKRLLNVYPTTSTSAGCGTVEMGNEVKRLFSETDLGKNGVLVMGGHKDGIIVFGSSLDEAGSRLLRLLDER